MKSVRNEIRWVGMLFGLGEIELILPIRLSIEGVALA